jgi:2-polyprenyl-6-methoxyphenol hydroxylase-like FAD-dependent oxidoreductase
MSPVRAQGINLALRDALVAARELLQVTHSREAGQRQRRLDQAAATIEHQRKSEVRQLQRLQLAELRQGHWVGHNAIARNGLSLAAPLLGPAARQVWMARQRPLREGTAWL